MTERALLPTGLEDVLPRLAQSEAQVVSHLMDCFASHGYERVKPPLIEFEDSLLTGSGAAVASHAFRVMDPVSQRMLAIRPDMTVQVERIASTRLSNMPRPLRLCYTGQVLRVKGSQLRPQRQFTQAGFELIGHNSQEADCEAIVLAVDALAQTGLTNLCVDFGLPQLVTLLFETLKIEEAKRADLRMALDRKDATGVKALGGSGIDVFACLLDSAGPAESAIKTLEGLALKDEAGALLNHLIGVFETVRARLPHIQLTIDVSENRGLEYHTGMTYTFFAKGARAELGRGGRYLTGNNEPASGCTLFVDSLMSTLKEKPGPNKVFIPFGVDHDTQKKLRADGFITLCALEPSADDKAEAARMGCTHLYENGTCHPLGDSGQD